MIYPPVEFGIDVSSELFIEGIAHGEILHIVDLRRTFGARIAVAPHIREVDAPSLRVVLGDPLELLPFLVGFQIGQRIVKFYVRIEWIEHRVFPFLGDPKVEGDPQACRFTKELPQFKIRL